MNSTVSRTYPFRMLGAQGCVEVTVELRYCRAQPYAVVATFHADARSSVQWDFSRDLLIEGMIDEAGLGDIRIGPADDNAYTIIFELRSPEGRAMLATDAGPLAEFLAASYELVAVGAEHLAVDVDHELTALLANDSY
jgi:Streptomyces sporulation and cell division protein, SsgA